MKSQRLNANVTVWPMLSIVIFLLMSLTFLPSLSVAAQEDPSPETQEVELYQDDSGEWKVRYVNAGTGEPTAASSQEPVITTAKAEQEPTEVELYQDDSGEWKVRYTTESQAPVQDKPVVAKAEQAPAQEVAKPKDETTVVPAVADVNAQEVKVAPTDAAKMELTPKVEEKPVAKAVEEFKTEVKTEVAKVVAEAKAENEEMNKSIQEAVQNARTIPMNETELATAKAVTPKPHSKKTKVPEPIMAEDNAPVFLEEKSTRNRKHRYELGTDVMQFKFDQDSRINNLGNMVQKENEGTLAGFHFGYEYTPDHPFKNSIKEIFTDMQAVNRYLFTLDYHTGTVAYSDIDENPEKDFNHHILEGRAVGGYDFKVSSKTRVTPFMGVGYRFQYDPSGSVIDFPPSGIQIIGTNEFFAASNFDLREEYEVHTHYLYIPIGLMTSSDITDTIQVGFNLELDAVLWGMIKSRFSKVPALYTETAGDKRTMKLKDSNNSLRGGFGLRASTRVTKKEKTFDWYVEPYFRYWSINESDEEQFPLKISDGQDLILFQRDLVTPYEWVEAENATTEYGIQVGVSF